MDDKETPSSNYFDKHTPRDYNDQIQTNLQKE